MLKPFPVLFLGLLGSSLALSDSHAVHCVSSDVVAAYFSDCSIQYASQPGGWGYAVTRNVRILMCDGKIIEAPALQTGSFFPIHDGVSDAEAQRNAALSCSETKDAKEDPRRPR